ncbi:MAG: hypothetical protein Q9201_000024 [Fulgogasparrea decipioides]
MPQLPKLSKKQIIIIVATATAIGVGVGLGVHFGTLHHGSTTLFPPNPIYITFPFPPKDYFTNSNPSSSTQTSSTTTTPQYPNNGNTYGPQTPLGGNTTPSSGSGGTKVGDLTYYAPGLGACGKYNTGNENICAISHTVYDAASNGPNPNTNPLCGHRIRASRGGRSVVVTVVDRCEACKAQDIDLSPGAFQQLAELSEGRVEVSWVWLDPSATVMS